MFQELGPDARGLLGVIAFFPQDFDEENMDRLFPTISDGPNIFDKFCVLSLEYQSNRFTTMLASLRDYLRRRDSASSPLLATTKECYFTQFSAHIYPDHPSFEESQWVTSEDAGIEHLLDVFTSIDTDSKRAWDTCAKSINHLYWYKPRLIMLGPKIEGLPDDHPSKAQCLNGLSSLFRSVGNSTEHKRLLTHTLKLRREREDDLQVAITLGDLSEANRPMFLREDGIKRAKEASGIFERAGDAANHAACLIRLAWVLYDDGQLEATKEVASRVIGLTLEKSQLFLACDGHHVLGRILASGGRQRGAFTISR